MDRFTKMASFIVVADTGSFTAAASVLGVSAQIVGPRINQLEERLGGPLLVRNTRKSRLTDAGRLFYDHRRAVAAAVDAAERSVAGAVGGPPRGNVVISAPRAFGGLALCPLIADYLRARPGVSVRLNITDRYRLVPILADYQGPARQLNLLYAATTVISPTLRSLIDAVVSHFGGGKRLE